MHVDIRGVAKLALEASANVKRIASSGTDGRLAFVRLARTIRLLISTG